MNALLIVLNVLLILIAIVLIVTVLMQEGNSAGLGAIAGGADTFFGKSKGKGLDAKLQLITKVAAIVFIVLAILSTTLSARFGNSTTSNVNVEDGTLAATEAPAAEATEAPAAEATEAPAAEATEAPAAEATEAPAAEATPAA